MLGRSSMLCTCPQNLPLNVCNSPKLFVALQIDIILAGDPQLAKEILYDMRQAENAARAAAEHLTAVAAAMRLEGGAASVEAARRLSSGSRTPGSGRGSGGRAQDLRQEALRRSLQLPGSSGSGGKFWRRR